MPRETPDDRDPREHGRPWHGLAALAVIVIAVLWVASDYRRLIGLHERALAERGLAVLTTLEGNLRAQRRAGAWQGPAIRRVLEEISATPGLHGLAVLDDELAVCVRAGLLPTRPALPHGPGSAPEALRLPELAAGERSLWLPGVLLMLHPVDFDAPSQAPRPPGPLRPHHAGPPHRPGHPGPDPREHRRHRHPPRDPRQPAPGLAPLPSRTGERLPERRFWLACAVDTRTLDARLFDEHRRFVLTTLTLLGLAALGFIALRLYRRQARLAVELQSALERGERLEEMNRVAAGLAHETRNPLMIIRGLAQTSERAAGDPEAVREQARLIIDEVDRITGEINGFLTFARPREAAPEPVRLSRLIPETLQLLDDEARAFGATLESRLTSDDAPVLADPGQLRQILMNLLVNALQAGAGTVSVATEARRGGLELIIDDDGPGIPAARRAELIKPYVSDRDGGTGLGLAIVDRIARAQGWTLHLEDAPGGGLRVRLAGLSRAPSAADAPDVAGGRA